MPFAIRLARLVLPAILAGGACLTGLAHELGKAQIFIDIGHESVLVTIPVDPDVLLLRLDALAGRPLDDPATTDERDRRLLNARDEFAAACHLTVDGQMILAAVTYQPPEPDSRGADIEPPGFMRLRARVTTAISSVKWSYGLAYGSYPLVVRKPGGSEATEWIVGAASSSRIDSGVTPSRGQVALRYLALGFTHILPKGLDHILFVLGIFLLSPRLRSVVVQVSSFTLAHSITLALTMCGFVSLPASIVEPLIALSIVWVAVENLMTSELKGHRVALVFGFGLLHGMGFAGVLGDLGLPRSEFVTALVTFNLGVEAGQLAVIALAFAGVAVWCRQAGWYRRRVVWPASLAIAVIGVYWTLSRMSG